MQAILTGKVRDVYDADAQSLVIVTTDRISAFDVILPTLIPGKGTALNKISNFWFNETKHLIPNHLISEHLPDMPSFFRKPEYLDRTVLVKKLNMLSFEFIVRGYIFGNMWNAYEAGEPFCGHMITGNYQMAQKLDHPILTPSTKAANGDHDIYVSLEELKSALGESFAQKICDISIKLYEYCYKIALQRGIIIADAKLEFGLDQDGTLVLADEIFTPDSSRFWDAAVYKKGESPKSYDKQFVRDFLIRAGLDGVVPPPELPTKIVERTSELYTTCMKKLT